MRKHVSCRVVAVISFALLTGCAVEDAEPEDEVLDSTQLVAPPTDLKPTDVAEARHRVCELVDEWCANDCHPGCGWAAWDWELYYQCVQECRNGCCMLWGPGF